jgi:hypothetical protein
LKNKFKEDMSQEIHKLEQNEDALYQLINANIHKIYEDFFFQNIEKITEKSKKVHNLEKRRMYIKLK